MSPPPVIFTILQSGARSNGGVQSITEIMRRLRRHRPIVLTNAENEFSEAWRAAGIEVHIEPADLSAGRRRNPLRFVSMRARFHRRLMPLIAGSGAKIVHCNDFAGFQLALPAVKLSRDVRIVLNIRDTLEPASRPSRLRYRFLFGVADHVLFLSKDMGRRWAGIAPNATRNCSVTYSIVDFDRFRPSPLPPEGEPPVVLLSGLIRRKKGQFEFLSNVAPVLAAQGIETWLAGDFDPAMDAYAAQCAQAAAPLGEKVRFLGYRSDIPELMARSTVLAVASRHEGLVRAMIEGMACARPIVSFDVCSAREILEDQAPGAGAVVDLGDHAGMAKEIVRYWSDRTAATLAGEKGLSAARRLFDADEVVGRYEAAYDLLGEADPATSG